MAPLIGGDWPLGRTEISAQQTGMGSAHHKLVNDLGDGGYQAPERVFSVTESEFAAGKLALLIREYLCVQIKRGHVDESEPSSFV